MARKRRLYLAYGSNLNVRAMRQRCPAARPVGWRVVEDAQLVFRCVADLDFVPGAETLCGLWEITAECERRLDAYEGVGGGLYGKYDVPLGNGETALIYLMNDDGVAPPSRSYVWCIREGYRDFGLDEACLDEAIERSWKRKEHSAYTARRRQRDGNVVAMPEWLALRRLEERLARQERRLRAEQEAFDFDDSDLSPAGPVS